MRGVIPTHSLPGVTSSCQDGLAGTTAPGFGGERENWRWMDLFQGGPSKAGVYLFLRSQKGTLSNKTHLYVYLYVCVK